MIVWLRSAFYSTVIAFAIYVATKTAKKANLRVHVAPCNYSLFEGNSSTMSANSSLLTAPSFVPADVFVDTYLRKTLKKAKVMLCSIMKNEELYIDEWLEYHRYLGFERAHLFDNADNASTYLASLPAKYKGYVKVTHLPGLGKQFSAFQTCVKEGAKRNVWAAFIDIDEFIVLREHSDIKAFLHDVAPDGGSVVLNWNIMVSNGSLAYDSTPVVERFTLTSVEPNLHVKTIAYLPHVRRPNIHNTYLKKGHPTVDQHGCAVDPNSPFHPGNDREIAHINHYYTKSWEEFKLKRHRGFASNFKKNYLYEDDSEETMRRISADYMRSNNASNAVQDTFARDFFLRNRAKRALQI